MSKPASRYGSRVSDDHTKAHRARIPCASARSRTSPHGPTHQAGPSNQKPHVLMLPSARWGGSGGSDEEEEEEEEGGGPYGYGAWAGGEGAEDDDEEGAEQPGLAIPSLNESRSVATSSQGQGQGQGAGQTVCLHFDVDAFYVTCERLRRPDLVGKPVAVSQFNRGGFVAVSYEAKARGVRKGDGIGERGQRELAWFKDRPDAVLPEVLKRCPELVVLPMDMPYYRSVHDRIYACLEGLFPVVMRNSLDDFYALWQPGSEAVANAVANSSSIAVPSSRKDEEEEKGWCLTWLASRPGSEPVPPSQLRPPLYAAAVRVAGLTRRRLKEVVGVSTSCGIGPNKLLARLASASPNVKPNGQAVVLPDADAIDAVLGATPLRRVPGLQQQRGQRLAAMVRAAAAGAGAGAGAGAAGAASFPFRQQQEDDEDEEGDEDRGLRAREEECGDGDEKEENEDGGLVVTLLDVRRLLSRAVLVQAFGESVGAWIHAAARGEDASKGVFTRPPPATLIVEASFNDGRVDKDLLEPLAAELLRRLRTDAIRHRRVPTTLLARYRLDYDRVVSRSARMPSAVTAYLRRAQQQGQEAATATNASSMSSRERQTVVDAHSSSSNEEDKEDGDAVALVPALLHAALDVFRRHLPPGLMAATTSSSNANPSSSSLPRLTRIVVGASGFEDLAPSRQRGAITRFLAAPGGGGGGGDSKPTGTTTRPAAPQAQAAAAAAAADRKGEEDKEEALRRRVQAAGYDAEVWAALPQALKQEVLASITSGGSTSTSSSGMQRERPQSTSGSSSKKRRGTLDQFFRPKR